ncbi:MAG: hypothetical protein Q8P52_01905 [bacterium]|nr:hypothetical protein [bacterium]
MNPISFYLEKFKNLGLSEKAQKDTVAEVASQILNTPIISSQVQIKNGEIKIAGLSASAKQTLFLNKDLFLSKIEEVGNINDGFKKKKIRF